MDENSPPNTVVGTVSVDDPDFGATTEFDITGGDGGGDFTIDDNGTIKVAPTGSLNYESKDSYSLDVKVTDDGGLMDNATMTININDVNEPPTFGPKSFTVPENSSNGTVVGTVNAGLDPEGLAVTYSIVGTTPFAIGSSTGQITVADGTQLDFEGVNPRLITVRAADPAANGTNATMTINITDVNEDPTTDGIDNVIINQGTTSAMVDLWAAFDDTEDDDDQLQFSVTGNTNPALVTAAVPNNATGKLTLTIAAAGTGVSNITVRAIDTGAKFVETTFTVDINEAPQATGTGNVTVAEDANNANVNLYQLFSDAEEADSALTYSVVSNTNEPLFTSTTINKPNLVLDFAPNAFGNATITVSATDSGGLSVETTVAVTVTSVNDTPTTSGINDVNVAEDAPPFPINLRARFEDVEDEDDQMDYEVTANSNPGLFQTLPKDSINPSTDVLTLSFKANTSGSADLTVRATDTGGKFVDASFKVTVSGENDPPTVSGWSETIDEDEPLEFSEADFASRFDDPDEDDLVRVRITQLPTKGTLTVGSETVALNEVIDAGDLDDLVFTPEINWDSGSTTFKWTGSDGTVYAAQPATVTINVDAVNDAPTVSNFSKSGDENETITFSQTDFASAFLDVDGDTLSKIRIETLPPNGTLKLGAANVTPNQQIPANNLDDLDFVPDPTWNGTTSFEWDGSDGELYSGDPVEVTITINPSNDPPELDLNGPQGGVDYSATFNSNVGPVNITSSEMTVSDVDSDTLQSATVEIANRKDGSAERLSATTTGTNITASFNAGSLSLNGKDTVANYQMVLRTVMYDNTSEVPNTDDRRVTFRVFDGTSFSNSPTTTVSLVNPRISLTVTPALQTIISGTSAVFTIEVANTGDVRLEDVKLLSDSVADCDKDPLARNLDAGESLPPISCTASNVTERIDNVLRVVADDSAGGPEVSDTKTAVVRIDNPNIQVDVFPLFGDTIANGDDARFGIIVLNPAQQSTLTDVEVRTFIRPLASGDGPADDTEPVEVPGCAFDVGDIGGGLNKEYNCTIPDIEESFTVEVVATGQTSLNQPVEDFDQANLFVLDLLVEVTSQPFELPVGRETDVTFTVTLTNLGAKTLTVDELNSFDANDSILHGDLLDGGNNIVSNNTCASQGAAPTIAADGGTFSCSYDLSVIGISPSYTNVIAAAVSDANGTEISARGETVLTVTDEVPVRVTLSAIPASLIAPKDQSVDGEIELVIQVTNNQTSEVTLTGLADDNGGDLNGLGDCATPQTIAANDSYSCSYMVEETGLSAGDTLNYSVTATVGGEALTATVNVPVLERGQRKAHLPAVTQAAVAGEPNDNVCSPMTLMPELDYFFLSDDANDWYAVKLNAAAGSWCG